MLIWSFVSGDIFLFFLDPVGLDEEVLAAGVRQLLRDPLASPFLSASFYSGEPFAAEAGA